METVETVEPVGTVGTLETVLFLDTFRVGVVPLIHRTSLIRGILSFSLFFGCLD